MRNMDFIKFLKILFERWLSVYFQIKKWLHDWNIGLNSNLEIAIDVLICTLYINEFLIPGWCSILVFIQDIHTSFSNMCFLWLYRPIWVETLHSWSFQQPVSPPSLHPANKRSWWVVYLSIQLHIFTRQGIVIL